LTETGHGEDSEARPEHRPVVTERSVRNADAGLEILVVSTVWFVDVASHAYKRCGRRVKENKSVIFLARRKIQVISKSEA
jgi:hypothetical protein